MNHNIGHLLFLYHEFNDKGNGIKNKASTKFSFLLLLYFYTYWYMVFIIWFIQCLLSMYWMPNPVQEIFTSGISLRRKYEIYRENLISYKISLDPSIQSLVLAIFSFCLWISMKVDRFESCHIDSCIRTKSFGQNHSLWVLDKSDVFKICLRWQEKLRNLILICINL